MIILFSSPNFVLNFDIQMSKDTDQKVPHLQYELVKTLIIYLLIFAMNHISTI